ncbi:hypothetical protein LIER_20583 [Lithospermum erythrorhizon]|uniref:Uncharacterized protein n=1 Tax=Lithospermum erythrorhizon TaxID=34254 RepID=A0AAV3QLZ3_LITER
MVISNHAEGRICPGTRFIANNNSVTKVEKGNLHPRLKDYVYMEVQPGAEAPSALEGSARGRDFRIMVGIGTKASPASGAGTPPWGISKDGGPTRIEEV